MLDALLPKVFAVVPVLKVELHGVLVVALEEVEEVRLRKDALRLSLSCGNTQIGILKVRGCLCLYKVLEIILKFNSKGTFLKGYVSVPA